MPLLGPKIGHVGTRGHGMANDEAIQPLQGGQGKVGGPQTPLLDLGYEIETPNWACRDFLT